MNVGDDVTINGKIIGFHYAKALNIEFVYVRLKSGLEIPVMKKDLNTIRPKIVIPDKDERRGK